MKNIGSLIGVVAIACGVAFAQSASRAASAKLTLAGAGVKGAPYSAEAARETTQTLADGTHIRRSETYTIYRDGEGRVRRESGDEVLISDPVAGMTYLLHTKEQTAQKLPLPGTDPQEAKRKEASGKAEPTKPAGIDTKSESLGKRQMEGLDVEGRRVTTVFAEGKRGNDRPMQMVHESWWSPELHVNILWKLSDPMVGDTEERLTNVQRVEPDPALFQVPAGFTMESEEQ
jgi:hypothetical protein